jgi:taurine dioxygenase
LASPTAAQLEELRSAWAAHLVLTFPEQTLDREAHKAFGRAFGTLHVHPLNHARGGDDEILVVKTDANSKYTAGDGWHTDVSCDAIPPLGSALYIKEVPSNGGGDTLFANMYLAWEALSEGLQNFLVDKFAMHDGALPYVGAYGVAPPEGSNYPRNRHPIAPRHPVTGRRLLYVNSGFTSHIEGLKREESRAILDLLFRHIERNPRFQCRVRWQPGTLTLWDNRCTQHHALWDYYPESRYGERVSIVGEAAPAL